MLDLLPKHDVNARTAKIVGASIVAAVLAADQITKAWALSTLKSEGVSRTLLGPLNATLVFNRSNAFGVVPIAGDLTRWGLVTFNVLAAAALVYWLLRYPHRLIESVGISLIVAGALGNGIDRLRLGVVVDFIDASALKFNWVFNIADAAVDCGLGCLLLSAVILPTIRQRHRWRLQT